MKRKVCIYTMFGSTNYGSNFQAIGLSKTIEELGYDVYLLDEFRVLSFFIRHPYLLLIRIVNRINRKKRRAFFDAIPYTITDRRERRLERFKEDNFKLKKYRNAKEWQKDINDNIIFVCGSDIIWNPSLGYPAINFLDVAFYAKLNRFSYASSIGALELPRKYYKSLRKYLSSMKSIGVREDSVANLLEPIIGRRPTKVIDPSLFLSATKLERYVNMAEISIDISQTGYILCYFVMSDKRYWEYIKQIKAKTKLQVVVLPMHRQDEIEEYSVVLDGTMNEFLWLIKNSTIVCTDSFHACVASTVFHKEFYLLKRSRNSENAKFEDFLSRYKLFDRVVGDENVFVRKEKIDYDAIDELIKEDVAFSIHFLRESLRKC